MSQRTEEGGMEIYKRGFWGIMREAQLGITLSLPVIDEVQQTFTHLVIPGCNEIVTVLLEQTQRMSKDPVILDFSLQ